MGTQWKAGDIFRFHSERWKGHGIQIGGKWYAPGLVTGQPHLFTAEKVDNDGGNVWLKSRGMWYASSNCERI